MSKRRLWRPGFEPIKRPQRMLEPQEVFERGTQIPREQWKVFDVSHVGTQLAKHDIYHLKPDPAIMSPIASSTSVIAPFSVQLKNLAGLGVGKNAQTAAHITWCYRASDLQKFVDEKDAKSMSAIALLSGQAEICLTEIEGYVDLQSVDGSLPTLVTFYPTKTLLRPLLKGDTWSRFDVIFGYSSVRGHKVFGLQSTLDAICFERCTKLRRYSASQDTLRFCDSCNTWFHLDCLTTVIDHADIDWFDPQSVHKSALWVPSLDARTQRNEATWLALLQTPIQRRYGHLSESTPVSFEIVLLAARRYHLQHVDSGRGVVPDVREYVSENVLGTNPTSTHVAETFTNQLLDIATNRQKEWWGCKTCGRFI